VHQNSRSQFKGLLDSPFYPYIMQLNFQPMNWVHSDWLRDIPFITESQSLTNGKVHNYIKQALNLSACQDSQFSDPIKRLIFLPSEKLLHLLNVIGLSCFQRQLSLLIHKELKQQIEDLVGIHSFKLLSKKLPLLISEYPNSLYVNTSLFNRKTQQLTPFFPYGLKLLALATEQKQSNWQNFLKLKLPKFAEPVLSNIELSPTEQARIRLLIQKIALDIEPECTILLK